MLDSEVDADVVAREDPLADTDPVEAIADAGAIAAPDPCRLVVAVEARVSAGPVSEAED